MQLIYEITSKLLYVFNKHVKFLGMLSKYFVIVDVAPGLGSTCQVKEYKHNKHISATQMVAGNRVLIKFDADKFDALFLIFQIQLER